MRPGHVFLHVSCDPPHGLPVDVFCTSSSSEVFITLHYAYFVASFGKLFSSKVSDLGLSALMKANNCDSTVWI